MNSAETRGSSPIGKSLGGNRASCARPKRGPLAGTALEGASHRSYLHNLTRAGIRLDQSDAAESQANEAGQIATLLGGRPLHLLVQLQ